LSPARKPVNRKRRKRGLEAGFFRYLTKPLMIDDFLKAVTAALQFG
jgi:DNA-binding response OmpR family regulator